MMNRTASKSKTTVNSNTLVFENLHSGCKKWLSEIDFWRDEIRFFKSVPKKYLEKISDDSLILNLKHLMREINGDLSTELNSVEERVLMLESMIVRVMQGSVIFDEIKCEQEFQQISRRIERYRCTHENTSLELKKIIKDAFRKP